jgi:hypothetical protein
MCQAQTLATGMMLAFVTGWLAGLMVSDFVRHK